MEESLRSMAILNLGKKIVEELTGDSNLNTIDLWMAHYVAEKMDLAKNETDPAAKSAAERDCFEIILRLWERRFKHSADFNPLYQLADVMEVFDSFILKSFEFYRYSHDRPKGIYGLFADELHRVFYQLIDALVVLAALPANFLEATAWGEALPLLLSEEEQQLVEHLTSTINRALQGADTTFEEMMARDERDKKRNYAEKLTADVIALLKATSEKAEKFRENILDTLDIRE